MGQKPWHHDCAKSQRHNAAKSQPHHSAWPQPPRPGCAGLNKRYDQGARQKHAAPRVGEPAACPCSAGAGWRPKPGGARASRVHAAASMSPWPGTLLTILARGTQLPLGVRATQASGIRRWLMFHVKLDVKFSLTVQGRPIVSKRPRAAGVCRTRVDACRGSEQSGKPVGSEQVAISTTKLSQGVKRCD